MVGISFLGNTVVFAQGKRDNNGITIEHIGRMESRGLPSSIADKWDSALKSELETLFRKIQQQLVFPDPTFHLILPSEWVHYYFLPVDPDLSTEERKAFLEWEARRRVGQFSQDLEFRFLTSHNISAENTALTTVYPQGMLSLFKRIANDLDIQLETVELDHFVGWSNLPIIEDRQYLCKFTWDTVSISEHKGVVFEGTGIFASDSTKRSYRYLRGSIDNAQAKHYQQILRSRSLLIGHQPKYDSIWIYGSGIPANVLRLIQETETLHLIRPLSNWNTVADRSDLDYESQYTEVVGAIRSDTGS